MPAAAKTDTPAPAAPASAPAVAATPAQAQTPPPVAADDAPAAAPDPDVPPVYSDPVKGTGVFKVNGRWVNAHGEPIKA